MRLYQAVAPEGGGYIIIQGLVGAYLGMNARDIRSGNLAQRVSAIDGQCVMQHREGMSNDVDEQRS